MAVRELRHPGRSMAFVSKGNSSMIDTLTENASGERGFLDEKQLLAKLPISRRTLGN
jgi:hypothetical protein